MDYGFKRAPYKGLHSAFMQLIRFRNMSIRDYKGSVVRV